MYIQCLVQICILHVLRIQVFISQVLDDCSAAYVDGSESGVGSTCVEVEFSLGMFKGSLCLAVWVPVVPLRISLSDTVLSPIKGWSYYTDSGYASIHASITFATRT